MKNKIFPFALAFISTSYTLAASNEYASLVVNGGKSNYYRLMYTHAPAGQEKTAVSPPKEVIIHEKSTPHDFNLLVYEQTGEFLTSLFLPTSPPKEIAFTFYKETAQQSYSKRALHKIIKESDYAPLTQTALASLPLTQKVVKYHPIDEELYFTALDRSPQYPLPAPAGEGRHGESTCWQGFCSCIGDWAGVCWKCVKGCCSNN